MFKIYGYFCVVEHVMFLSSTAYNYQQKIEFCNWTIENRWRDFFLSEHRHVFQVLQYHMLITILIEVIIL